MATTKSWQTAEIPGPIRAFEATKSRVISAMINRSERPLMVVGHEATNVDFDEEKLIDYTIKLSNKGGIPIIATAHIIGEFSERGYSDALSMSIVEIGNRLSDENWNGIDGDGQHDLVLLLGLPYYMGWLVLSNLKHFAKVGDDYLKTISLDRYYQPNALWSFPNLKKEKWVETLRSILDEVEVK